jgi:hypothetical protein
MTIAQVEQGARFTSCVFQLARDVEMSTIMQQCLLVHTQRLHKNKISPKISLVFRNWGWRGFFFFFFFL